MRKSGGGQERVLKDQEGLSESAAGLENGPHVYARHCPADGAAERKLYFYDRTQLGKAVYGGEERGA